MRCRMPRCQRAGVIKRNAEVENISVWIKKVRAWINRLGALQRDKFAELQIKSPICDERQVQAEKCFDQIGLKNFIGGAIEQT